MLALTILMLWIVLPTLHVIFSPRSGPWLAPEGTKCPFGPRLGWLTIVIMLGLVGWIMFIRSRNRFSK
jgi:hypothetical protein